MHQPFVKTVRRAAESGWGQNHKTEEEAMRALTPSGTDLAGAAMLEIVRRLNQVIKALADDRGGSPLEEDDGSAPEDAKAFPGSRPGRILYGCPDGLEYSVREYVVLTCLGDYVRVIEAGVEVSRPHLSWAGEDVYATEAEAVAAAAQTDLAYYGPRAEWARKALRAVGRGADLSAFREENHFDKEGESDGEE